DVVEVAPSLDDSKDSCLCCPKNYHGMLGTLL
ncbi:unnamed protein product, partial [marine sediment metagenome]